jgi:hypothetical protein
MLNVYALDAGIKRELTKANYTAFNTEIKRNSFLRLCDKMGAAVRDNNLALADELYAKLQKFVKRKQNSVKVSAELHPFKFYIVICFKDTSMKSITLQYTR